jgi:CRISPR-associated protein Cas5h
MDVVAFTYSARFGHFLRAEANANGPTYPVPPRTALLGMIGAVLGLEKDEPQDALAEASVAVGGPVPQCFWHKTNLRKDPPAPLPWTVKATDKGTSKEQRNTIHPQEWLWRPKYRVWASLPDPYQGQLADRLLQRRWHFSPCMGLSEMLAELADVEVLRAQALPAGTYCVGSVVRAEGVSVDTHAACEEALAIQTLRMPRAATADRVFSHATYFVERNGRPIPVECVNAWQVGEEVVASL